MRRARVLHCRCGTATHQRRQRRASSQTWSVMRPRCGCCTQHQVRDTPLPLLPAVALRQAALPPQQPFFAPPAGGAVLHAEFDVLAMHGWPCVCPRAESLRHPNLRGYLKVSTGQDTPGQHEPAWTHAQRSRACQHKPSMQVRVCTASASGPTAAAASTPFCPVADSCCLLLQEAYEAGEHRRRLKWQHACLTAVRTRTHTHMRTACVQLALQSPCRVEAACEEPTVSHDMSCRHPAVFCH